MSTYARDTKVDSASSHAEIERTLTRYGATAFSYGWQSDKAAVIFEHGGRRVRFILPLPDRDSREFTLTPTGKNRAPSAQSVEYERAVRQRWRALALVIKAKLEAVESGIVTFNEEFLAHLVPPNNRTVYEETAEGIAATPETVHMRPLLQIEGNQ